MPNRSFHGAALAALALSFAAPAAYAADDAFCKEYARAAVNQFRTAAKHRRCDGRLEGSRWSTNFKSHYEWCREVKRDEARSERNERKKTIEECTRRRD